MLREGSRIRLLLWGNLPFEWCGNLSLHCRVAEVSIQEVDAKYLTASRWAASLLVESLAKPSDLASRNFLAMARHRPRLVPSPEFPELYAFHLSPMSEASALLRFRARDRIGLLSGVLDAALHCGLRPNRISARTLDGTAEDWLELAPISSAPLTAEALIALRERLARGLIATDEE